MKCYDCKKLFIKKTDLMKHRIADHPEKVKACKHGDRCSFSLCWYKHKETIANVASLVTNEAGNEIRSPMAIVILGGLMTATFLNLYVVPCVYSMIKTEKKLNGIAAH